MKNHYKFIANLSLLVLAVFSAASAEAEYDEKFKSPYYLAPYGTYLKPGGDSHGFGGWGTGAAIGRTINEHFNIEVRGFWQNYSNDFSCCGGETDMYGATVDGQYYFVRNTLSPYLVAGIGGVITDIKTSAAKGREGSFIFEAGVGSTYQLTDNFLIRGDVRYRLNTLPDEVSNAGVLNDLVVNLGLVINLGNF